jgi:uncharacterized protein (DUF305 family)
MKTLTAALACSMLLAACAADSSSKAPPPPAIPQNDVAFIDGMVPHHQMAIDMANEEVARGASGDVKMMAQAMIDKQQQEIDLLEGIRQDLTGSRAIARVNDEHTMADITELQSLAGTDLDVAFLQNMIPHHANAVVMSHRAIPNLTRSDLVDFAHSTIDDQTEEMAEMLDMKHAIAPAQ